MSATTQNYAVWVEREQEIETHAVFHCRAETGLGPDDILARVKAGVTAWMRATPEGQRCIADDTWEFNIGDVALRQEVIAPWLIREGLYDARVEEPHCMRGSWVWDTRLVDSACSELRRQ